MQIKKKKKEKKLTVYCGNITGYFMERMIEFHASSIKSAQVITQNSVGVGNFFLSTVNGECC